MNFYFLTIWKIPDDALADVCEGAVSCVVTVLIETKVSALSLIESKEKVMLDY